MVGVKVDVELTNIVKDSITTSVVIVALKTEVVIVVGDRVLVDVVVLVVLEMVKWSVVSMICVDVCDEAEVVRDVTVSVIVL